MSGLTTALLILGGLALIAFGSIGLLFVLSGEPPDTGALGSTGGSAMLGLGLVALGLRRLFKRP